MQCHTQWAQEEFAHAQLGDARRSKSLVRLASAVANKHDEVVYGLFDKEKEQHAAYRFLSNPHFHHQVLLDATAHAVATRAQGLSHLLVPTDPSSICLRDPSQKRQLGKTGNARFKARGLIVSSAIALTPQGLPLGPLAQKYWPREPKKKTKAAKAKRRKAPFKEKETFIWTVLAQQARSRLDRAGCDVPMWFQFDRGADCHDILNWASDLERDWVTVRMAQGRKTDEELWQTSRCALSLMRPKATGILHLPRNGNAQARDVEVELFWQRVPILLRGGRANKVYRTIKPTVVYVRSTGSEKLSWHLLTTYPVKGIGQVLEVVRAYSLRWVIEEYHRTWKSVLKLEENRLERFEAIVRWAIIKTSVAMRIERLKRESRAEPDKPALELLDKWELEALCVLKHNKAMDIESVTLGEAVLWLGQLGGYSRPSASGGHPPGSKVIARGFERVCVLAQVLKAGVRLVPPD